MTTCLTIDNREHMFIERMKGHEMLDNETIQVASTAVKYKITTLPVGDFVIESSNGIEYIIERKTIKDLCASITDGRFRDQKERMMASIKDASKIIYIIEGSKQRTKEKGNTLSQVVIDGSIQNLIFRHNFKVLQTENEEDTFNNIVLLYKKVMNKQFETSVQNLNCSTPKLLYKKDKILNDMMAAQLSVIPGLSYNMAKVISTAYPTMQLLMEAYKACSSEKEQLNVLSDLQLTAKRRLGDAVAQKVYDALHK